MIRRAVVAGACALAFVIGVADLGRRADERELGIGDCLRTPGLCDGRAVQVGYYRVAGRRPDGVVILERRGVRLEVGGMGPEVEPGPLARVSLVGTWTGPGTLEAGPVLVHRWRRLKEAAGVLALLLWGGGVARFAWRRRGRPAAPRTDGAEAAWPIC